MRIVMISETVGDAFGQERVVRDSTALLRREGHEVYNLSAIKTSEPQSNGYRLLPGLFQVQSLTPWKQVRALHGAARDYINEIKPDVVHLIDGLDYRMLRELCASYPVMMTAHTVAPTCPASGRLIYGDSVCTEKSGWKCLLHNKSYGCLSYFKSDLHRIHNIHNYVLKRSAMRGARVMGAISQYVETTLLEDGWPREQVRLVYNPVVLPAHVERLPEAPRNLITVASRLVPMKGIDYVLGALKKLEKLEWTLWVCGEGPSRDELLKHASRLGLESRVVFLGATSFARTQRILASSRVLVQGNLGPEGFGLAVAEASGLGVPVVAFDVPALGEIISHGESGLLARPKDADSLAGHLETVLTDEALCERFGLSGKRIIRERFSPERHLRMTLDAYAQCTLRPAPSISGAA